MIVAVDHQQHMNDAGGRSRVGEDDFDSIRSVLLLFARR